MTLKIFNYNLSITFSKKHETVFHKDNCGYNSVDVCPSLAKEICKKEKINKKTYRLDRISAIKKVREAHVNYFGYPSLLKDTKEFLDKYFNFV